MKYGVAIWVALAVACAGDDAGHDQAHAGAAAPDAAAPREEQASAPTPGCVPPPDCLPIQSSFLNLGVCCSDTLRCGFDLSILTTGFPGLPQVAELFKVDPAKPCVPRKDIFLEMAGQPERRVPAADGGDILIAPSCPSRFVANTTLAGCCLPDGKCGYSTHLATSTLRALGGSDEPAFTKPECVRAGELNAQLAASALVAWAHVPESTGSCDYAALDARLPRP